MENKNIIEKLNYEMELLKNGEAIYKKGKDIKLNSKQIKDTETKDYPHTTDEKGATRYARLSKSPSLIVKKAKQIIL